MAQRLVFHAGPHKTASTYLQNNLHKNARALAAGGWSYPAQGKTAAGHHQIVHAAPDWLEPGGEGRKLLAKAPRNRHLVFSGEGAARWSPARYHAVADALGRDQIDVVYVLRDPVDLFQSNWAEQVKQGQHYSMGDRLAEHLIAPMQSELLNPSSVLEALLKDARINLRVIPFEILKTRKIDIFTHFGETVLGIEGLIGKSVPGNERLSIFDTEFLRLITSLIADGRRRISSDLRHLFFTDFSPAERRAFGALIQTHGTAARRRVTIPADYSFRLTLERQMRAQLAGCWTLDPGAEAFFGRAAQDIVYYDTHSLLQVPEIADAAEHVLDQLNAQTSIRRFLTMRWGRLLRKIRETHRGNTP